MPISKLQLQVTTHAAVNWASYPNDRCFWSEYSIFINKISILWKVIKQTCTDLSPMGTELIAVTEASKNTKYTSSTLILGIAREILNDKTYLPTSHCKNPED